MRILEISEENKKYFQQFYKQHDVIGLLVESEHITRIIVKMKKGFKGWTPTGCARDCGDYLIIAMYSQYVKVDKKTKELTLDVEDL